MYQAVLVLSVILFATVILALAPFLREGRIDHFGKAWGRFNLFALEWICGLKYRIRGLEHLPREASIVLCKHQSAWETIALRGLLPAHQSWVLKRELMRIPFFGAALVRFRSIAIDRTASRRAIVDLLRSGKERLEEGRWVIVFPEGTRVAPGTRGRYALGGAMLAERSGRLVVPVAHNAGVFWGRRSVRKKPGTIDLVFGVPIETEGRKAVDINAEVEEWIESNVAALLDVEHAT